MERDNPSSVIRHPSSVIRIGVACDLRRDDFAGQERLAVIVEVSAGSGHDRGRGVWRRRGRRAATVAGYRASSADEVVIQGAFLRAGGGAARWTVTRYSSSSAKWVHRYYTNAASRMCARRDDLVALRSQDLARRQRIFHSKTL